MASRKARTRPELPVYSFRKMAVIRAIGKAIARDTSTTYKVVTNIGKIPRGFARDMRERFTCPEAQTRIYPRIKAKTPSTTTNDAAITP
jgi:hypothetical protein